MRNIEHLIIKCMLCFLILITLVWLPANARAQADCVADEVIGCSGELIGLVAREYILLTTAFADACLNHDYGYRHGAATYGYTRKQVDDRFLVDMQKVCRIDDWKEGLLAIATGGASVLACEAGALAFYGVVRGASGFAWKDENEGTVCYYQPSNTHIYSPNNTGRIGKRDKEYRLNGGITDIAAYEVSGKTFLLSTGRLSGRAQIHEARPDGSLIERHTYDWSPDWTSVVPYQVNGTTYMLFLRERTGDAHFYRPRADGSLGTRLYDQEWRNGWANVVPYQIDGETYMLFLRKPQLFGGDALRSKIHTYKPRADGSLGSKLQGFYLAPGVGGFTSAEAYQVDGKTYIMFLKSSNGKAFIFEPRANGTLIRRHIYDWGSGWTSVKSYQVSEKTYMLFLKIATGESHIYKPRTDGSMGSRLHNYAWNWGWYGLQSYTVADRTFMLFNKPLVGD